MRCAGEDPVERRTAFRPGQAEFGDPALVLCVSRPVAVSKHVDRDDVETVSEHRGTGSGHVCRVSFQILGAIAEFEQRPRSGSIPSAMWRREPIVGRVR